MKPEEVARFQLAWQQANDTHSATTHLSLGSSRVRTAVTLSRADNGMLMLLDPNQDATTGPANLREELDRLREQNQLSAHFINTAVHEFSTPLTPLRLQAALLKSQALGPLNERQQQSVEVLERNMRRLSQLVQDVLDISRLEAGRFRLNVSPIDLGLIVQQTVNSVQPQADEQGLELVAEIEPGLETLGDADRLTQVLFNLLTNAVKFTPRGGRILVRARRGKDDVQVSVEDTGRGFSRESMARLFQPFAPRREERGNSSGSGLGLSIAHGIITQHGGRIWAESEGEGRGSTFLFTLPWTEQQAGNLRGAHRITRVDRRGTWNLFYFRCPDCASRDIDIKLRQNLYHCNHCRYAWR